MTTQTLAENAATNTKIQTHRFDAEVGKVLQLVIHSLYTNRDIFLRELVSNAADACDKLRYEAILHPELLKEDTQLRITINFDKAAKTLTIRDNGIGMSHDELVNNLGTIARSGTQAFLEAALQSGKNAKDMNLIGQFGVGFYSAFMVADRVSVVSRKAGETQGYRWESDGKGEYTVEALDTLPPRGTEITLHMAEGQEEYLDRFRIDHIVKTYSDHITVPVYCIDEQHQSHLLNSASALWLRPKSEITPEQYTEFYRHAAHAGDEPFITMHYKTEGTLEYSALLFVPSHKPFDLLHPERRRRVKLYVKRVFITEDGLDIIPVYLRFLRGVIDSEDLPLNISRETLQHNAVIAKIRQAVTKRVLSELKKKVESDPEGYDHFWRNLGGALKEGLCDSLAPVEDILEVCRFESTLSNGKLISLSDYIEGMKPGQEEIYYLIGDNAEIMKTSPQLEGFRARGIEVLLLTDPVDDFWVNVVHEYQGRGLKSVTKAEVDLNKVQVLDKPEAEKAPETEANVAGLIAFLKETLGAEVKDVRTTSKLAESPVCLAASEKGMDIRMERFLIEQMQISNKTAKILEINPSHPLIEVLAAKIQVESSIDAMKEVAFLLLDQARVIEGEQVGDPGAFSRRMTLILAKALGN